MSWIYFNSLQWCSLIESRPRVQKGLMCQSGQFSHWWLCSSHIRIYRPFVHFFSTNLLLIIVIWNMEYLLCLVLYCLFHSNYLFDSILYSGILYCMSMSDKEQERTKVRNSHSNSQSKENTGWTTVDDVVHTQNREYKKRV